MSEPVTKKPLKVWDVKTQDGNLVKDVETIARAGGEPAILTAHWIITNEPGFDFPEELVADAKSILGVR